MRKRSLGQTYSTSQIQQMITSAAQQYGVPASLALAVAQVESNFNPNAVNTSNANGTTDYGVFQINSSNLASLGISSDPTNAQANIDAGVSLLAKYYQEYDGDVSQIAWAYNAGPGSVASGNMPASTASYVAEVTQAQTSYGTALPSTDTGTSLTTAGNALTSDTTGSSILTSDVSIGGVQIPEYALIGAGVFLFLGLWIALD